MTVMVEPLTPTGGLRADAARNRVRVLNAARELLAAGSTTLPMNAIARRAGVGVGTVYRHFPNPQALLESLAMDGLEQLVAEAQAAAADDDPGASLERLLRGTLRGQLLARDGLASVLRSSEKAMARTSHLQADLLEATDRLLGRAREAGAVRADIRADDLQRLLCGIDYALRASSADRGETDRYLDVLVRGIRPDR